MEIFVSCIEIFGKVPTKKYSIEFFIKGMKAENYKKNCLFEKTKNRLLPEISRKFSGGSCKILHALPQILYKISLS